MAETKVSCMVLKVDLSCPNCDKNVRKILAKIPEVRDQVYNKSENEVKITAVCCCPEKIRDRLREKGRKVIKSIEIIEPAESSKGTKQTDPPATPPVAIPETDVVEGIPVHFPVSGLCPMCSGGGCPWCYGYGKFVPQPPPASQFHNYYGYGDS